MKGEDEAPRQPSGDDPVGVDPAAETPQSSERTSSTDIGAIEPVGTVASPGSKPADTSQDEPTLRKSLAEKDAQLQRVISAYRKLKQETDRLRKRITHTEKRRFEQSKGDFIAQFVEVLDNLDRAIDAIENNFDSDSVLEGIILVRSRMVQLLREEGLEKIFVGGQAFDPTHSEAAGIEPVEDESKDNIVLKELQRGYMLKGALLRPARVVVGRYSRGGPGEDVSATDANRQDPRSELDRPNGGEVRPPLPDDKPS